MPTRSVEFKTWPLPRPGCGVTVGVSSFCSRGAHMKRMILGAVAALVLCTGAGANEVLPPASARFAAKTEEVPDFQRHVVPLFGRMGCNGRACHGSFQGQGGFRLSLFGYDFAADRDALVKG